MEEQRELNLLLMSMSKLAKSPSESYYRYEKKNIEGKCVEKMFFCGVSQLEAGTKYYLRKLQKEKEGRKIDKIFIVESVETRKTLLESEQKDVLRFVNKKTKNAVDFYKERINQYTQGNEKVHAEDNFSKALPLISSVLEYEKKIKEEEEIGRCKPLKQLYPEQHELFEDVKLEDVTEDGDADEHAIYRCASELCEKIQKCKEDFSDNDVEVKLFIDMQGARRYETFIINATVKMLDMRGIKVESSVAVNFDSRKNEDGDFNDIVDTTMNDRIFEMVSGMDEFIKTGRDDTLLAFQKHSEGMIYLNAEKDILKYIKKISEAISICDVKKFEEGLNSFKVKIREYRAKRNKDLLFQTYVSDLENDYQKYALLDETKPELKNEIAWCLDKKLYQQALTLVEAKIPILLVDEKILYYHNDKELKEFLNKLKDSGWINIPDYLWKKDNGRKQLTPDNAKYAFIKYVLSGTDRSGNRNGLHLSHKLKDFVGINWEKGVKTVTEANRSKAGDFLADYSDLCAYRNDVNHASGLSLSAEDLKRKIKQLLIDYESKLKKNNISIDLSQYVNIKSTLL